MDEKDTFHRDLKKGKEIEQLVLKFVKSVYDDAYIVDGYCKDWDIYIPSREFGIEVKSDLMSRKTGNIVVETSFNGRPSALETTKAKLLVFYTGDKLIFTTPENIRKVITKHRLREVSFTGKGDTASKTAFLVKQFFLEEVGFVCAPDLYLYKSFNFDFSL